MSSGKPIGILLIVGAVGVFIPYFILTMIFDYPDILREDAGLILAKFNEGGSMLILTWFLFAILGFPLLIAYIFIGQKLEDRHYLVRLATILGIISGIVQIVGLLRWTFVVPILANDFINANDETTKEATKTVFRTVHQYGGVLLGEHLGQLLTVAWTFLIAYIFNKLRLFPKWVTWFGYISATIYLLAQAGLFRTVIPGFPVWELAGLVGSSLWLIWLIIVGVKFYSIKTDNPL